VGEVACGDDGGAIRMQSRGGDDPGGIKMMSDISKSGVGRWIGVVAVSESVGEEYGMSKPPSGTEPERALRALVVRCFVR
jgi:hypothetical protein